MRIAFFGTTGPFTLLPLTELAREHEIVAVVRPGPTPSAPRALVRRLGEATGLRTPDPVDRFCRTAGLRRIRMRSRDDHEVTTILGTLQPDLICIASFRWILEADVLASARLGAINLHGSLLPRHRGAVPLFWIFHSDDRETGVTVHRASASVDAGEILGQDRWSLPRGTTADELDAMNAVHGARLLKRVVGEIASGENRALLQDEARATRAPVPPRTGNFVDFKTWPTERVWHFLHGVHPYYLEQIGPRYGAVLGWEAAQHSNPPGSTSMRGGELVLFCSDGFVCLRPEGRR